MTYFPSLLSPTRAVLFGREPVSAQPSIEPFPAVTVDIAKKAVQDVYTSNKVSTESAIPSPGFWSAPSVEMTRPPGRKDANMIDSIALDAIRHLFLQQAMHPDEKSHLKLHINDMPEAHPFALADGLALLDRPVDIVISSVAGKDGLAALVNTGGRAFMTPQATIELEPPPFTLQDFKPRTNSQIQEERWLTEQVNQMLTTHLLEKAGITDRKALLEKIKAQEGTHAWNPMQALYEGKHGFIDGVLVKQDQVVTRADLDTYFKAKSWSEKQIQDFIQDAHNIEKIPARKLTDVFPETLPSRKKTPPTDAPPPYSEKEPPPPYSEKELPPPYSEKTISPSQSDAPKLFIRKQPKIDAKGKIPEAKPYTLPNQCIVQEGTQDAVPSHLLEMPASGKKSSSILNNDSVFYSTSVKTGSMNRLVQALKRLGEQRVRGNSSNHHIALFLSSPGGSIIQGRRFIDELSRLRTPVDIIVNGQACSAAVMSLLIGATGKRLATPHSELMIHESSVSGIAKAHEIGDHMQKEFENMIRLLAEKTGRSLEDVREDTKKNYWLNPLEALFYGDKGLLHGIVVGPNKVITKAEILPYLVEKLGSVAAVEKRIKERLEERRNMAKELMLNKFDPEDPLANFTRTIREVARRKDGVKELGVHPDFLHSGANRMASLIEHIPVKTYKPFSLLQLL